MKKNLYFRQTYKRKNPLVENFITFVKWLSSYPGLVVEVFMRKNFGERYFTFYGVIVMFLSYAIPPLIYLYNFRSRSLDRFEGWVILLNALVLLGFAAIFIIKGWRHRKKISKYGSTYDFERFSYYSGDLNPLWYRYQDKVPFQINNMIIEKYLEPALFMVVGIAGMLMVFTFVLGLSFFACGVIHGLHVHVNYYLSRQSILDMIDEKISNIQLHDAFVEEKPASETQGFQVLGALPPSRELREELYEVMMVDEDETALDDTSITGTNHKELWN